MGFVVSHILLPLTLCTLLSSAIYRKTWAPSLLIMSAAFLLDADHLLADPAFDPSRCSIGFHPLHSHQAIALYALLLCHPRLLPLALGVFVHLGLDALDCMMIIHKQG